MSVQTRLAKANDAVLVTDIVCLSIRELCVSDHHNDPATLDRWLANKTPANFESWIQNQDNHCVVGEIDNHLCGVGLLHSSGEIRLFYLAPGTQRHGLGAAIHAALEEHAHAWGLQSLHLQSTDAARPFYEAMGYVASAPRNHLHGRLWCYPYRKWLQPCPAHMQAPLGSTPGTP